MSSALAVLVLTAAITSSAEGNQWQVNNVNEACSLGVPINQIEYGGLFAPPEETIAADGIRVAFKIEQGEYDLLTIYAFYTSPSIVAPVDDNGFSIDGINEFSINIDGNIYRSGLWMERIDEDRYFFKYLFGQSYAQEIFERLLRGNQLTLITGGEVSLRGMQAAAQTNEVCAGYSSNVLGPPFQQAPPAEPAPASVEDAEPSYRIIGTGFAVSEAGLAVTAAHVVAEQSDYYIFDQGHYQPLRILERDPVNDVAVLDVPTEFSCPLSLGFTRSLSVGDDVATSGFPMADIQGITPRTSFGRVNALRGLQDDPRFIQFDAAILPGNSGGALLNEQAQVIGVVTSILDPEQAFEYFGVRSENVAFALRSDYIAPLLGDLANLSCQQGRDPVEALLSNTFPVYARWD